MKEKVDIVDKVFFVIFWSMWFWVLFYAVIPGIPVFGPMWLNYFGF